MLRRRVHYVFLGLVSLLPATSSVARTWVITTTGIGADAPHIQAGVDSASNGDIVMLAAGIYRGAGNKNVDFKGKAIHVTSSGGALVTEIDCEGEGRAFLFQSGEGLASIISGVRIVRGVANFFGGAIFCSGASPTVRDNIFNGNQTGFQGGAVYCDSSSAILSDNVFEGNGSQNGGALWCSGGSDITVTGNQFINNVAGVEGAAIACNASSPTIDGNNFEGNTTQIGAAVSVFAGSAPNIRNNTFLGNTAVAGSGIRCQQASPTIRGNIFAENGAWALLCEEGSSPVVEENTFRANAGAIRCVGFSDPAIRRNIFVANGVPVESAGFSLPTIGCCCFSDEGDLPASSLDEGGNFTADPLFCGGGGYDFFGLSANSPCLPGQHPQAIDCGLIGARDVGCGASPTEVRTWGAIKSLYGGERGGGER
jgi:predicted outer membrane repeat protein